MSSSSPPPQAEIMYRPFDRTPADLAHIVRLVETELSEPYTVYTYRYFLHQWPCLAFLAFPADAGRAGQASSSSTSPAAAVGIVVCKLESHRGKTMRGYLAMLSVDPAWRQRGIAKHLLRLAIEAMRQQGADEVVLETEADNVKSLALYQRMGFWREKRLWRFYLNGKDAFRLILPLRTPPPPSTRPLPVAPRVPPPPPPEDDFGPAPFLSAESFAPVNDGGSGSERREVELSEGLKAVIERVVREERASTTHLAEADDNDDGDETELRLPAHRRGPPSLIPDGGEEEDDIELDEGDLSPSPPTREAEAGVDDHEELEALEVSDEEVEDSLPPALPSAGSSASPLLLDKDETEGAIDVPSVGSGDRGQLAAGLTGVRI